MDLDKLKTMKKIKTKDLQVGDIYCTEQEYKKRWSRKALVITDTHVCSFDVNLKLHKTRRSDNEVILLRNHELTKQDLILIERNRF